MTTRRNSPNQSGKPAARAAIIPAGAGGWSRQPTRDWSALTLSMAAVVISAGLLCLLIAIHAQ